jgi:hypothetical protein
MVSEPQADGHPEEKTADSPQDLVLKTLYDVIDKVKEKKIAQVLILWEDESGDKTGFYDSEMSVSKCVYLCEAFKAWILRPRDEEEE